jgi:hypothetical protein
MWVYILTNNPGAKNTYHNDRHMYRMAGIAVFLYRNSEEYANMSAHSRHVSETLLLIACLWHDYGHSAGAKPDAENIQFAIESFTTWWIQNAAELVPYIAGNTFFSEEKAVNYALIISDLLRVTEFPFVHTPKNTLEFCIRDADLLYTFDTDTGNIVHGLYLELKSSGKFPAGFSFMNFMSKQAEFLDNCTHFTGLGRQLHADMKDDVLARQFAWAESQGFA